MILFLPFFLLMIAVVSVLIGIGFALGLACALCGAALVALGIISSSALLAVLRRRVSSGLRAMHYQFAVALGVPCGIGLMLLATRVFEWSGHLRAWQVLTLGTFCGVTAGGLLALAGDYALRLAWQRLAGAERIVSDSGVLDRR